MPITQFEEIHKGKIEYQIHERYQHEIKSLNQLGFSDLHFTREITFPLSAVFMCWAALPMKAAGEIFSVEKPFRFVLFNPLMLNYEFDTYANVFGMGVKFVTLFRGKGVLISCNYETKRYINPKKGIYRYGANPKMSIEECFSRHRSRIEKLEEDGLITDEELSLPKFERGMEYDDMVLLFPF